VPLSHLAEQVVSITRHGGQTPVLVIPAYLSLRSRFYVELSRQILSHAGAEMGLRIDWLCGEHAVLNRLARFQARRINQALQFDSQPHQRASIEVTGSIGRVDRDQRVFVLGQCREHQDLPHWTQKIQLIGLTQPFSDRLLVT